MTRTSAAPAKPRVAPLHRTFELRCGSPCRPVPRAARRTPRGLCAPDAAPCRKGACGCHPFAIRKMAAAPAGVMGGWLMHIEQPIVKPGIGADAESTAIIGPHLHRERDGLALHHGGRRQAADDIRAGQGDGTAGRNRLPCTAPHRACPCACGAPWYRSRWQHLSQTTAFRRRSPRSRTPHQQAASLPTTAGRMRDRPSPAPPAYAHNRCRTPRG